MTGLVHSAPVFQVSTGLSRWEPVLRTVVLPAFALLSLALGLGFLVDPASQMGTYVPLALFALGLAVLSGLVTFQYRYNPPLEERERSLPRALPSSRPGRQPSTPVLSTSTVPSGPVPTGAGSEWRILSAPTDPGDETWISWLPRERRRLGPASGSPGPGVVPSQGKAGTLVAFPVRNYYGVVPPSTHSSASSSRGERLFPDARSQHVGERVASGAAFERPREAGPLDPGQEMPFSVEELDRMFPPVRDRHSVFLTDVPQKIGGLSFATGENESPAPRQDHVADRPTREPSGVGWDWEVEGASTDLEAGDRLTGGSGTTPLLGEVSARGTGSKNGPSPDARRRELSLEAENPVPPHLRAAGPIDRDGVGPGGHGRHGSPGLRSVCASCSKVVVNLRMSGPCPRCLRPVCDDCLREAFVTAGCGWCRDCSRVAPAAA